MCFCRKNATNSESDREPRCHRVCFEKCILGENEEFYMRILCDIMNILIRTHPKTVINNCPGENKVGK